MNLQQPLFPVKDLTFGFYGREYTHFIFESKDEDGNVSHSHRYGSFDIIKLEVPLAQFVDGPPRPGTWTYPFSLELPDWLPMSFKHGFTSELSIIYTVYARFTPINDQDWSDKKKMVSSFMATKDITIDRPPSMEPDEPIDYQLKSSVGGFIGISKTKCNTQIHLDKKEFYLGERIAIRLQIDNSGCEKDVKNVKVRIQETRKGTTNKHLITKTHKSKTYHFQKKDIERVPRGETAEKVIFIDVGASDFLYNSIKPSINGKLI